MEPQEHFISVQRTARYHVLGIPGPHINKLWIVLHGYGQQSKYFIRHFMPVIGDDTLVIAPEGLSLFYVGQGWQRVGASWMTKEKRESEIKDYTSYLDGLWEEVANQVPENCSIGILGFSQGVTTAWRWLDVGKIIPDVFVVWAGGIPEERISTTSRWESESEIFYIRAMQDEFISDEQAKRSMEILKSKSNRLTTLEFDGNHRMDEHTLAAIMEKCCMNKS
jgi:predicted esterase